MRLVAFAKTNLGTIKVHLSPDHQDFIATLIDDSGSVIRERWVSTSSDEKLQAAFDRAFGGEMPSEWIQRV